MAWKGKFDVQTIKITTNKGNNMIRIITTKRLKELHKRIEELEGKYYGERQWREFAEQDKSIAIEIKDNLEKKVNEQREIIVNMMILLDFFSQKLLRKHNKKGGKK